MIKSLLEEQATYMPAVRSNVSNDIGRSRSDVVGPGPTLALSVRLQSGRGQQFQTIHKIVKETNGNPCMYFYCTTECQNNAKFSFAVDQWRAVYCLCNAPTKKEAVDFMKTIHTDNAMDMDMQWIWTCSVNRGRYN